MGSYLATPASDTPLSNTITLVYYDTRSENPITRYKTYLTTEEFVIARNLILLTPMLLLQKAFDLNRDDIKTIISLTCSDEKALLQTIPETSSETDPECSYIPKLYCQ